MHLLEKEKSGYLLKILFVIAFIIGVSIIIYAGTIFITDNVLLDTGKDSDYNTGWICDLNGLTFTIDKFPACY